jgi:hypothetical protein
MTAIPLSVKLDNLSKLRLGFRDIFTTLHLLCNLEKGPIS